MDFEVKTLFDLIPKKDIDKTIIIEETIEIVKEDKETNKIEYVLA